MGMVALSLGLGTNALAEEGAGFGTEHPAPAAQAAQWLQRTMAKGDTGPEVQSVYEYLRSYGYFPNPSLEVLYPGWKPAVAVSPADPRHFGAELEAAVRLFQQAHGLKEDGTLNAQTRVLMNTPRCGFPDLYEPRKRVPGSGATAEFVPNGYTWADRTLSYYFDNYTGDLPQSSSRAAVLGAFARWSAVTDISFYESSWFFDRQIHIGWFEGDHGDGYPFDGTKTDGSANVLAHAFPPENGDIHFDDAETWRDDGSYSYDLPTIALHEAGHAIGLSHSNVSSASMYAYYSGLRRNLAEDDVAGIGSLYGTRRTLSWSSSGPIPGKWCVWINEEADPHTWTDNYLCSDSNLGIQWSNSGPIGGMRCTQITEPAEPGWHTWGDNYLCVPTSSSLQFSWAYDGPILGKQCVQWHEFADPHTWTDNFLCY